MMCWPASAAPAPPPSAATSSATPSSSALACEEATENEPTAELHVSTTFTLKTAITAEKKVTKLTEVLVLTRVYVFWCCWTSVGKYRRRKGLSIFERKCLGGGGTYGWKRRWRRHSCASYDVSAGWTGRKRPYCTRGTGTASRLRAIHNDHVKVAVLQA